MHGRRNGGIQSRAAEAETNAPRPGAEDAARGPRPHRLCGRFASRRVAGDARLDHRRQGRVTPAMVLRLGKFFGNGPELWMGLQADFDLREAREKMSAELAKIKPATKVT